jgi:hypothetical protein
MLPINPLVLIKNLPLTPPATDLRSGCKEELQETGAHWKAVEDALLSHHHKPDLQAAVAVCASLAAHRLKGAPVWPMLVAPPGSMKTHLLGGFDGLNGIHFIDQITPKTFISGQLDDPHKPNQAPASLLHRIGTDGTIVYPDFSTVLAMKRDSKAAILADMRRIYDGHLKKEFGTSEKLAEREWRGRITFVVAVTPAIDQYYSIFQTLGERFVMIRWPRAGGIDAALAAMNQQNDTAKAELKTAMHALFNGLPSFEPTLPFAIQRRIAALTEIAVRGRTHVPRTLLAAELGTTSLTDVSIVSNSTFATLLVMALSWNKPGRKTHVACSFGHNC